MKLSIDNAVISILWDDLKCEICRSPVPLNFIIEEKTFNLLDFKDFHPQKSLKRRFLVLEIFDKDDKKPLGLYFVDFNKKEKIKIVKKKVFLWVFKEISLGKIEKMRNPIDGFFGIENSCAFKGQKRPGFIKRQIFEIRNTIFIKTSNSNKRK